MTSADILLVEDNEDDVLLTLTALKRLGFGDKTAVCRDGVDALEYLFREGSHAQRDGLTQPKLVLLDIKLPKIDGIEVVRRLKKDTRTKSISVVMLTSSSRQACAKPPSARAHPPRGCTTTCASGKSRPITPRSAWTWGSETRAAAGTRPPRSARAWRWPDRARSSASGGRRGSPACGW